MGEVIAACFVLLYAVAFGAIAGELAHRDIEIDRLRTDIERLTMELAEAKRERDRVMRNAEWD